MDQEDTRPQGGGWWQITGAALLVGAVVGVAWFAVNTPVERRTVAETPAPAAVVAATSDGDIAKILKVEPPAEPAPIELTEGQTLVCGQVLASASLAEDRIASTLQEAGAAEALAQFAQQQLADDDHARAVGLVLRMHADANYRNPGAQGEGVASCRTDDCWKREAQAHAQRVAPLLTELAALAGHSTDARVMTLAREQCHLLANDAAPLPHCQTLTARRLVAIDRDNAAAWLALAAEEPAAIDEAMYQAAIAPRWNDHALSARRFIERVDAKGGLRSMVLVQALLATPATQPIEGSQRVLQHCSAAAVANDANRRQQCEQLALGLRARSNSLMGLTTAGAVAKSIGRDDADAWRDDARLLTQVLAAEAGDDKARASAARECAFGLPREALLRSAKDGEVAVLRALMKDSGLSEVQWREKAAAAQKKEEQELLAAEQRSLTAEPGAAARR